MSKSKFKIGVSDSAKSHWCKYLIIMKINWISVGIPKVHWYGEEAGYCILVMELLNENIEEIFTH